MCRVLTSCVGFLFNLIALLACLGAFALPHWVFCPDGCSRNQHIGHLGVQIINKVGISGNALGLESFRFEGLLVRVSNDQSWKYFWEDDFRMEQDLPDWYKAAQALYTFGFVILLSTVLLALMHVACRCCCQKAFSLATVIGSLIFSAFVLIGASVGVFVAFQMSEEDTQFIGAEGQRQFFFAVYVAGGGLLAALLSSILFLADGCQRQQPYEGYQTTRMI